MGNLREMANFLQSCRNQLKVCDTRLSALQEKYETFFQEIQRAREHELQQLREHLHADRRAFPADTNAELDAAWTHAERDFTAKLDELTKHKKELDDKAETQRQLSQRDEDKRRGQNVDLDTQEEALKKRAQSLLDKINAFNQRARQLGSGFGFFVNFFKLRELDRQRQRLIEKQADIVARVDDLRQRWQAVDKDFRDRERARLASWQELRQQATAAQLKIESLREHRARIVERSALEAVLFAREPQLPQPAPGDPPCKRCTMPHSPTQFFCAYCGQRLQQDRQDVAGSLLEVAELNRHHQRFMQGMQACQNIIGLVRGLDTGLRKFVTSVDKMIGSQNTHNLRVLRIEVPASSRHYAKNFERLRELVSKDTRLHPLVFAQSIQALTHEVFTEDKIQAFFEAMGEELSRQADLQW